MGSLTSTPKSVSTTTTTSTSSSSSTTTDDSEEDGLTQKEESEERKKSLLASERSRSGTVSTSLHGILSSVDENKSRKTLLGQ